MDLKATKSVFHGFQQSETQSRLLSYRDKLEKQNVACSLLGYDYFQKVNNKGIDQSVQMRRMVCDFGVHKHTRQVFLTRGPYVHNRLYEHIHVCLAPLLWDKGKD